MAGASLLMTCILIKALIEKVILAGQKLDAYNVGDRGPRKNAT
jgi:hypothetical protein